MSDELFQLAKDLVEEIRDLPSDQQAEHLYGAMKAVVEYETGKPAIRIEIEDIVLTDVGIEIVAKDGKHIPISAEYAIDLSKWIVAHHPSLRNVSGPKRTEETPDA